MTAEPQTTYDTLLGVGLPKGHTARSITELLYLKHEPPEWAAVDEMQCGTGFTNAQRLDFFAFHTWPSKGFHAIAYEIKITRADFMRALQRPDKRAFAERVGNECYFVVPTGLIGADEVPQGWGLMEASAGGCPGVAGFHRSGRGVHLGAYSAAPAPDPLEAGGELSTSTVPLVAGREGRWRENLWSGWRWRMIVDSQEAKQPGASGRAFTFYESPEQDVHGAIYVLHYQGEPTGRLYVTDGGRPSVSFSVDQARDLRDYIDGWLIGLFGPGDPRTQISPPATP